MRVMENCEIVKLRIPEEAPFLSDIEWKFPEQQKNGINIFRIKLIKKNKISGNFIESMSQCMFCVDI